jgi:hypothetical protein
MLHVVEAAEAAVVILQEKEVELLVQQVALVIKD